MSEVEEADEADTPDEEEYAHLLATHGATRFEFTAEELDDLLTGLILTQTAVINLLQSVKADKAGRSADARIYLARSENRARIANERSLDWS
jgi:hypothetical protein